MYMVAYGHQVNCNNRMIGTPREHPIIVRNADLVGSATETYGEHGAEQILDGIIASYEMGHDYLPALTKLDDVTVVLQENNANWPVVGSANLTTGKLTLRLNMGSTPDEIISELPNTTTHEVAHLVHLQRNPQFFVDRREPSELHFGSAVLEGIAAHAGRSLGAFTIYSEAMFAQQKVIDALAQLLENPEADQHETYEAFMFGDRDVFSNRGYRVGEYVVSGMARELKLGVSELMDLPLDEFKKFAKGKLV